MVVEADTSSSIGKGTPRPLTRERLAQLIEDLELQLQDRRNVA